MEKKMRNISSYFLNLGLLFATPQGWLASILTMVLAYFSPIYMIIIIICIFVIMDLITGVLAAKKKGEEISSHIMRNTVTKLLCYWATIVMAFLIQKEIVPYSWFIAVNLSGGIICLAEFKSLIENFGVLTGSKTFKKIFTAIENLFKKNIDNSIEKENNGTNIPTV